MKIEDISNNYKQTSLIISKLAKGIDPISGTTFPADSPYTTPAVIHALKQAARAINKLNKISQQLAKQILVKQAKNRSSGNPINNGLPWNDDVKNELKDKYNSGLALEQLASHFERTYSSIEAQLEQLEQLKQLNLRLSDFTKRRRLKKSHK